MKLTLTEMAEFAEVVAAIAIVISLIFVGIQLQNNSLATRSANANASTALVQNWYQEMSHDSEAVNIFIRGLHDPTKLSQEDWAQFIYITHSAHLAFQNTHFLVEEGTLDNKIEMAMTSALLAVKDQPGFQLYWSQRKSLLSEGYRNFIEESIFENSTYIEASAIYKNPDTITE